MSWIGGEHKKHAHTHTRTHTDTREIDLKNAQRKDYWKETLKDDWKTDKGLCTLTCFLLSVSYFLWKDFFIINIIPVRKEEKDFNIGSQSNTIFSGPYLLHCLENHCNLSDEKKKKMKTQLTHLARGLLDGPSLRADHTARRRLGDIQILRISNEKKK